MEVEGAGQKRSAGVRGDGKRTVVMLNDSKLLRNGGWGALVRGARLECNECSSQGNKLGGFKGAAGSTLRLVDCTSKRDHKGVVVGDSQTNFTRVVVEESAASAFCVRSNKHQPKILNCKALECKGTALVLEGRGEERVYVDCFKASGMAGGNGALVSQGSRADLKTCS